MADLKNLGERLYRALGAGDGEALTQILSPDFVGDLTPGLPLDLGRKFEGRETMMRECWGTIGQHFAMHSEVEMLIVADGMIVAHGSYLGKALASGRPINARFAHFWRVKDGKVVSVHQTTDSAAWREALNGES